MALTEEQQRKVDARIAEIRAAGGNKPVVEAKDVPVTGSKKVTAGQKLAIRLGDAAKDIKSKLIGKKYQAVHEKIADKSPTTQRRLKLEKVRKDDKAAKDKKKEDDI